jgi:hypothetical protein
MRTTQSKWLILALTIFLIPIVAAGASPTRLRTPKVGEVLTIPTSDQYKSWKIYASGLCPESDDCVFDAGPLRGSLIIVVGKPVDKDSNGGIRSERVASVSFFPLSKNDVAYDCEAWLRDVPPILTLLNEPTRSVRDFYLEGGRVRSITHQYKVSPPCDIDP